MQHRLRAVDVLDKAPDAAEKGEILLLPCALVVEPDLHAIVEKGQFTQAFGNDLVVELYLAEDLLVGHEMQFRSTLLGLSDDPQR
ncbi:MAG: hypothetical protein AW07_01514 [Candidatus Accumulibacter sp. SK-11]|nr:MAG: hypothetical protein AW07_01514 [Candidatus Accumulibacter sp. SK-11]